MDYEKLLNVDKEVKKGPKSAKSEDIMSMVMRVTLVAQSMIKWTNVWTRSK